MKGCLIFLHREVLVDNDCCRNYRQKYYETIPDGVTAIGINAFDFKKDESPYTCEFFRNSEVSSSDGRRPLVILCKICTRCHWFLLPALSFSSWRQK